VSHLCLLFAPQFSPQASEAATTTDMRILAVVPRIEQNGFIQQVIAKFAGVLIEPLSK
jgi:hypothetical protein